MQSYAPVISVIKGVNYIYGPPPKSYRKHKLCVKLWDDFSGETHSLQDRPVHWVVKMRKKMVMIAPLLSWQHTMSCLTLPCSHIEPLAKELQFIYKHSQTAIS